MLRRKESYLFGLILGIELGTFAYTITVTTEGIHKAIV
jgi:hypothetical protein